MWNEKSGKLCVTSGVGFFLSVAGDSRKYCGRFVRQDT